MLFFYGGSIKHENKIWNKLFVLKLYVRRLCVVCGWIYRRAISINRVGHFDGLNVNSIKKFSWIVNVNASITKSDMRWWEICDFDEQTSNELYNVWVSITSDNYDTKYPGIERM